MTTGQPDTAKTSSPPVPTTPGGEEAQPRILIFTVYGSPAPQGSKSYKGKSKSGRAILVESSKAVEPWREAVKHAALYARGAAAPMAGPLGVAVTFTVPKPSSAPKRRRTWPAKRPDIDKLLRSTFDALGEAGVWRDDAQVVSVHAVKAFPGETSAALDTPGARLHIFGMGR